MTKFQINQTYGFRGTKWAWILFIQNDHPFHVSASFDTFGECLEDMGCYGESILGEAEAKLKAMSA